MGRIQMGMLSKELDNLFEPHDHYYNTNTKMALGFLHYFNLNTNLLANIWYSKHLAILLQLKPL